LQLASVLVLQLVSVLVLQLASVLVLQLVSVLVWQLVGRHTTLPQRLPRTDRLSHRLRL
jgi:hypothetical protein